MTGGWHQAGDKRLHGKW